MIGKTISHYRIIEKLGEGGMGVVYKAEDTKLKRTVALKFLSPRIIGTDKDYARLTREARTAAALSHPAICTVHEIDEAEGHTFIAMELIEGEGLGARTRSGSLPLDEALSIAVQIAEGLAEAHAKGVVHRDIKPANLVVTPSGRVKIMDFGLARLSESTGLTKVGTTLGTIAYMSPEQARGDDIDCRTDVWSMGVVLYEMLTGQRPFRGNRDQAVIYSIVNEEPEPMSSARPGVPPAVERVVSRMLAKDPDSRHRNAGEVMADLQKLAGGEKTARLSRPERETDPEPSVAVLPFADMSPERDQEYFCDGIAEELINALTHVQGLRVSSRTSSFQFKDGGCDVREIGRKLGARAVLEGSVRKAGSRLRITAQLVSVTDGYHLWSERFDRNMDDVFAIQDEISAAIVKELQPQLLGATRAELARRHTENQEAYDAYLKGRWFWNMRTHDGLTKAIECFKRAIELSPDYAVAYAGMADSYNDLSDYSPCPPENTIELAREAAQKALELDDSLAEAHASLGQIKSEHDCDWDGAENDFKRAIALNPDYAPAHYWYGHLLCVTKGFDAALEELRQAEKLEPHSLIIKRNIGYYLFVAGEYGAAVRAVKQVLDTDTEYSFGHFVLGMTYTFTSKYEEALEEFDKEVQVQGGFHPLVAAWKGAAYARSGRTEEAERILATLKDPSECKYPWPSGIALLCLALGRDDEAYEWLERARVQGDAHLFIQLGLFRRPDVAGGDPRFAALLERMGLES